MKYKRLGCIKGSVQEFATSYIGYLIIEVEGIQWDHNKSLCSWFTVNMSSKRNMIEKKSDIRWLDMLALVREAIGKEVVVSARSLVLALLSWEMHHLLKDVYRIRKIYFFIATVSTDQNILVIAAMPIFVLNYHMTLFFICDVQFWFLSVQ